MRIIKTDKHERTGNDCMIYNTLTLYEHGGEYFFQIDEKVTGWAEDESSRTYELGEKDWNFRLQKKIDKILKEKFYGSVEFNIADEMNRG